MVEHRRGAAGRRVAAVGGVGGEEGRLLGYWGGEVVGVVLGGG